MRTYVLDANAVILFLLKGVKYERVAALVKRAAIAEARLVISVINWGEVLYSTARIVGLRQAKADLKALSASVETMVADQALAQAAATIRLHYRLGYADCFAAALAMHINATLVTTDSEFSKMGKKLKILVLSRYVS